MSAAAGVQPTIIYRQFGDMQGLLDAVIREAFAGYVRQQAPAGASRHQQAPAGTSRHQQAPAGTSRHQEATREHAGDAVEDLRRGWDLHVAFGVANPAAYVLVDGDPRAAADAPAARDAEAHLHRLVTRVPAPGKAPWPTAALSRARR